MYIYQIGEKVKIIDAMDRSYIGKVGTVEEISEHAPYCCKLNVNGKKGSWANAWLFSCIRKLTKEEIKEEKIKQQAWNDGVMFGQ
ncbi:hypothetical protein [Clostridium beijerinckii]|uniref:hypothetical protein n=1 Tax=Clostridium beijerinckii TaxID=1520 RepID=UPI00156DEDE4|nr:hypothetical protein [Clostridium beijerinckii]NRU52481.1 hypothetical protein [Clostridium beijerinckii]NYC69074.1 hypothetical protein [Clostridium beijerinckii]NYC91682.1 hypothetical protein [Clostridium beijerinckii]